MALMELPTDEEQAVPFLEATALRWSRAEPSRGTARGSARRASTSRRRRAIPSVFAAWIAALCSAASTRYGTVGRAEKGFVAGAMSRTVCDYITLLSFDL